MTNRHPMPSPGQPPDPGAETRLPADYAPETVNVLECISDGFLALDRDFYYTYVNAEAERILGMKRSELQGQEHWQIFPATLDTPFETRLRRAMLERSTERFENYYQPWNRWFDVRVHPALDGGLSIYFRDISAQKLSDESLRESEARFSAVMMNAPAAIFIKDLEGRYTLANPLARQALGRPEGVIGLTDAEMLPAEVAQTLQQHDREVMETGRPLELEEVVQRDGYLRHFLSVKFPVPDADGRVVGVCGVAVDITARKLAEAGLRTSEAQFRTLANSIPQLAWMARPDGYIFWYNQRWYDYTGTTLEEMQGWGWQSVHAPQELPRVVERFKQSIATGQDWEDTFPLRRHDGELRWHLSRALPVRDERGRIVLWFGTNTDITEHRRLEMALREADRRKDEFLATLAHELRNPLAPIRTGLEVMKLAADDPTTVAEVRGTMERQVSQMVRLIDDLLDVSRITRGRLQLRKCRVELAEVVQNAVEAARPFIDEEGHQLTVELPEEPVQLTADPNRLAQVLANLLNNAAKYTPAGGRIWLSARRWNGQVEFRVRDTGLGIPAEMRERIFEMFAQVDRSLESGHVGLGIGLTLVKTLIDMHGGRVEVHSDGPSRGSEFRIVLPLVEESGSLRSSELPAGTAAPASSTRRLLVVDDNRDAANGLCIVLEKLGHEVQSAFDGRHALEVAEVFRPDVVLMDLGMPNMNGFEAARRIRGQAWGEEIVLVALTGWGQDEDRRRSREAGFDHHLVKPVDPDVLLAILSSRRC